MADSIDAMKTYPDLMAYILDRSAIEKWYQPLRDDEAKARAGEFADVVADLDRAKADYAAAQRAIGPERSTYPYNSAMGDFLGLPLQSNHEPPHGYYMANCVASHYRLGIATRAVASMIEQGRELAIVTARAKKDGRPVRFARFRGPEQIKIEGDAVIAKAGRYTVRMRGGWSHESAMMAVADAMRDGHPYGHKPPPKASDDTSQLISKG